MRFEKFIIKIQTGVKNIQLKNLFQGNRALENIGNSFINSNSDFFLTDVIPALERNLSDLFTNIANRFDHLILGEKIINFYHFNRITGDASFDELFPNI